MLVFNNGCLTVKAPLSSGFIRLLNREGLNWVKSSRKRAHAVNRCFSPVRTDMNCKNPPFMAWCCAKLALMETMMDSESVIIIGYSKRVLIMAWNRPNQTNKVSFPLSGWANFEPSQNETVVCNSTEKTLLNQWTLNIVDDNSPAWISAWVVLYPRGTQVLRSG